MKAPRKMTPPQRALWGMQARMRSRMDKLQITQTDLAQATKLSRSYIWSFFSAAALTGSRTRGPGLCTILNLAQVLKCDPGWLAFGEKDWFQDSASMQDLVAEVIAKAEGKDNGRAVKGRVWANRHRRREHKSGR